MEMVVYRSDMPLVNVLTIAFSVQVYAKSYDPGLCPRSNNDQVLIQRVTSDSVRESKGTNIKVDTY